MKGRPGPGTGHFLFWKSPVGWIGLVAGAKGLREVILQADPPPMRESLPDHCLTPRSDALLTGRRQLDEFFRGERLTFDLPLDLQGLSPFATKVLHTLLQIPYGTTISYGELGELSGFPRTARAVGGVMARNPLPIVIPCHRVIGAGGRLTGYSGGEGLATKEWLLRFEREWSQDKIIPGSKSS